MSRMMKVAVSEQMFNALEKIAEHDGTTVEQVTHAKLLRILTIEREEWIAAHPPADVTTLDLPVGSCTEENLRAIAGDDWVLLWWLLGCWALPG